jgi:hypothetical protein
VIIFGSVRFLSKKITKPTGFGSVWLFWTKTGSNRFGSVFSGFGSVFSV